MDKEKEILTAKDVCEYLDVTRSTLWLLEKKEEFPKPVKILTQKKWRRSEIDAYLESTRKGEE